MTYLLKNKRKRPGRTSFWEWLKEEWITSEQFDKFFNPKTKDKWVDW